MSTIDLEDELARISQQFSSTLKIDSPPSDQETKTIESPPSDEETIESPPSDDETDDEEEFSFSSARSVEDTFIDGQIFPVFDQTLLISGEDDDTLRPPVKTVLVESSAGQFREFTGNSAGDSPETCEKSNSTGFSNMWRFREMGHRSNSDGRDAFVYMKRESERRERVPAPTKGQKGKISRKGKGKTAAFSAHYVESRERREKDKKRTYLPYKPGFFGIFTSIRGGLTKNVHPY